MRIREVMLFVEAQEEAERVPVQDMVEEEMDCFMDQIAK